MTKVPATIMFPCVVSRETIRIALRIATVNDLKLKSANILKASIQVSVIEKVWTTLDPEFGSDASPTAVIVKASYGLNWQGQQLQVTLPYVWNL